MCADVVSFSLLMLAAQGKEGERGCSSRGRLCFCAFSFDCRYAQGCCGNNDCGRQDGARCLRRLDLLHLQQLPLALFKKPNTAMEALADLFRISHTPAR